MNGTRDTGPHLAVERGDAPVGALDVKMPHDVPIVINVRAAGDRNCSTDPWTEEEWRDS